jgi:hypothetical protein
MERETMDGGTGDGSGRTGEPWADDRPLPPPATDVVHRGVDALSRREPVGLSIAVTWRYV